MKHEDFWVLNYQNLVVLFRNIHYKKKYEIKLIFAPKPWDYTQGIYNYA